VIAGGVASWCWEAPEYGHERARAILAPAPGRSKRMSDRHAQELRTASPGWSRSAPPGSLDRSSLPLRSIGGGIASRSSNFDRDGLAIWYKRLEAEASRCPAPRKRTASNSRPAPTGDDPLRIDLRSARQRKRFQHAG